MQVKVLSVKNPFAYLILQGGKDVENRTWTTDYRGRLYIHVSGDTMPYPVGAETARYTNASQSEINTTYKNYADALGVYMDALFDKYVDLGVPTGAETEEEWCQRIIDRKHLWQLQAQRIVGYVDLVDIVQDSPSMWAIDGQYHWMLKNPTLLENPIRQVKGRLGLWNYNLP